MPTLTHPVHADDEEWQMSAPLDPPPPYLMVGEEVVEVLYHPRPSQRHAVDRSLVRVRRGVVGEAADHTAGTTVTPVFQLYGPSPILSTSTVTGDAGPHTHPDLVHDHPFADMAHTHDTTHGHDLSAFATQADLDAHEASPHGGTVTEPLPHDHDDVYAPIHTHDFAAPAHVHTAAEVGAALAEHSHDLTHSHDTSHTHDLSAYATDAEVTSAIDAHLVAQTHGGGGATHSHTAQPAIANVVLSGATSNQLTQLRDKQNAVLAALRAAGIIAT